LPEVRQRLVSFGIEPIGSTPASFQAFLLADSAKWGAVIREANLKIEQ
jgi:tripartite-type tricarboxylate transporter receptor subunit TctC